MSPEYIAPEGALQEKETRAVLEHEGIPLAQEKQHYGRAELTPSTKFILKAMRVYMLASFIPVAAQIYIGLHQH